METEQDNRKPPNEKEQARIATARERWIARVPPVEAAVTDDNGIGPHHNDPSGWTMRIGDTLGTRSPDFMRQSLTMLNRASRSRGKANATEQELNASLALVAAIKPEDELEAALAIQMAANHALTTDVLSRACNTDSFEWVQLYGNLAVKLQRTFTAQVEALAKLRGKGQQTVRVEHVTVHPGGQAIVGDVYHGQPGAAGVNKETAGQPYGTDGRTQGAQGSAPMLSQDATGHGVPIPGNAERSLSPARRTVTRRARQPKRSEARDV